jgi:hypothetical protein
MSVPSVAVAESVEASAGASVSAVEHAPSVRRSAEHRAIVVLIRGVTAHASDGVPVGARRTRLTART